MTKPTHQAGPALAYLVPEFPSQTHAFFWRELQAIEQAGVRVQLFSTRRPPADACQHAFASEATARTTYVYPPSIADALWLLTRVTRWPACLGYLNTLTGSGPKTWAKRLGLLACAAGLARRCKRDHLQHLHAHSCADAAHLAALAHHFIHLPFSTTLHGDLPVYGTDHPQKAKPAAFVAAVTKPLQQQLIQDAGLTPDRAPVVWMGVDTDRFSPPAKPAEAEGFCAASPANPQPLTLLTVARLNPTKGHTHALAAIKSCVDQGLDIRYRIAGNGPNEQAIRDTIAKLQLQDRVELLGSVSEDRVLELLHDADAFVLPSFGLGEAAPVSVMEAMATGLPVVCSIIGGTPDMITTEHDGILTPQQDEAALADAFARLAKDPTLRQRLGSAARTTAQQRFDYRRTANRLLAQIWPDRFTNEASPNQAETPSLQGAA